MFLSERPCNNVSLQFINNKKQKQKQKTPDRKQWPTHYQNFFSYTVHVFGTLKSN